MVASEEVGDIFRGGKAYDVHVWSTPETRNSVSSVRQLPIDTPGGEQITLEQVADVRLAPTPNAIERVNQSRRIDVGANVEGRHSVPPLAPSRIVSRLSSCRLSTPWRCWESPASWQLPSRTC